MTPSDVTPFHLAGPFAPVHEERTDVDLEVLGELPRELVGAYVRNGPNPRGRSPGWFSGEGMLHAVRLEGGRAHYRNRWIEGAHPPNTNIVRHAGRLLALVETRLPAEVTPELATIGPYDFGGAIKTSMTAHPRICPRTGELVFFSYGPSRPHLTIYRADAEGRVIHRAAIDDVSAMTYMHDFAITERYVVFYVIPVLVGDWRSPMPLRWVDDLPARFGVMPRDGGNEDVRWFDVAPCAISHTLNAYEEAGTIVVDATRAPRLMTLHALHRFTLDLRTGRAREATLDPRFLDFPRVHPAVVGAHHRLAYTTELGDFGADGGFARTALWQHDLDAGRGVMHDFGPDAMPGECVIVPRAGGASEEDAWVIVLVHRRGGEPTELAILDAARFAAPPVARVRLRSRVPLGFHGEWLADA